MSTQLRNTGFAREIDAFLSPIFPSNPAPFVYALLDGIREQGDDFLKTDQGKVLLYMLNSMAYGQGFWLNGAQEYERLQRVFGD